MTPAAMVIMRLQLAVCLLLLPSCISRGVNIPPFIPPASDAALKDLIAIVNERREIQTLTARVPP